MDFTKLYQTTEALHRKHTSSSPPEKRPLRFVHVINPVDIPKGHDLDRAQAFTYASMRRAKSFAQREDQNIEIELCSAALKEDEAATPDDFITLPLLDRCSKDIKDFEKPRNLPLVYDMLHRARERTLITDHTTVKAEDTYIILTNVDIGLMPQAYAYAAWLIRRGYDISIINRRGTADIYHHEDDVPALLSDYGHIHPGLDFFCLRADHFDRFIPFTSVIGIGHVMRPFFFNLMAVANEAVLITDAHTTFHIGLENDWRYDDYADHNHKELLRVISEWIKNNPAMEQRLKDFVHATNEHKLLPEGLLGVKKSPKHPPLMTRIKRKLIKILEE